jgi:hypothetical protein
MTTAAGMAWRVHTMSDMGMIGVNFLAWHRQMLLRFEQRLQQVHPSAFIPYWDWIANPNSPARISEPALLGKWSVDRDPNAVHIAIGGDMTSASSPTDPLFFMHHANVDRLWYKWQEGHPAQNPSNMDEVLKPTSIFDVLVSSVVDRTRLPYSYA